jgi:hypothetical protein
MAIRAGSCICGLSATAVTRFFGQGALGAEGGSSTYLKGYKGFLSGIVPPEAGFYVRNDLTYYSGDISKTIIGGRVSANLSEWLVADLIAATYVTPVQMLGGTYAVAIGVPIDGVHASAAVSSAFFAREVSDDATNFGDILISPIILGRHFGNIHVNAAFGFTAPVGQYNTSALADTGFNRWSYLPQLGFTYFDPATGWDFSFAPTYVISGAKLGSNKASVWALGPLATYNFTAGTLPLNLIAKWTHEIEATRAVQGDTVTLAVSFKF